MAISLVTIIVMGLLLYHRFKLALEKTAVDNTEATVEATVDRLNADLLDIRQILNGANYNVVQQFDISSREFSEQFSLLYETNSDKIQSLALYDPKGNLIASEPVAAEKKNVKVQTQEWYKNAEDAIENIHFSTPHIQELFEDGSYRYQMGRFPEQVCRCQQGRDTGNRYSFTGYEIFCDQGRDEADQ